MEEPFLGKKLAVQRAALHIQDAWSGMQRIHPREGPVVRQLCSFTFACTSRSISQSSC